MKNIELILLVVIGYGVAPFTGAVSAIWPIFSSILLFTCLGVVLFMAMRAIIEAMAGRR